MKTIHHLAGQGIKDTLAEDDPLVPVLETRLAVALGGNTRFGSLGLRWPDAAVSRAGDTVSFRTNDVGGYGPLPLDPTLDVTVITARFARIPEYARTDELRQSRLIPCADQAREHLLTAPIPMDHWLTFETTINGRVHLLCEGRWHVVEGMRAEVIDLMARRSSPTFPASRATDEERSYRKRPACHPG
nr:TIGR04141 family sporadically distributed protein [Saccharothrix deserti]